LELTCLAGGSRQLNLDIRRWGIKQLTRDLGQRARKYDTYHQ